MQMWTEWDPGNELDGRPSWWWQPVSMYPLLHSTSQNFCSPGNSQRYPTSAALLPHGSPQVSDWIDHWIGHLTYLFFHISRSSHFFIKLYFPHFQGLQRWLSAKSGQVCDGGMNQELRTAFLPIFVNSLSFQLFAPFYQIRMNAHRVDWYTYMYPEIQTMHITGLANGGPVHFTDQINVPDETAEIPPKLTIQESVNTWHTCAHNCWDLPKIVMGWQWQ